MCMLHGFPDHFCYLKGKALQGKREREREGNTRNQKI